MGKESDEAFEENENEAFEENENSYELGSLAAWRSMLSECLRHLPDVQAKNWATERLDVIIALREICKDYGDNDWDDDMHLGDVIRKSLLPYLAE